MIAYGHVRGCVRACVCLKSNMHEDTCVCVCVCHVRRRSQVSVMCDDHYCHTPAPLPQLTLPMQMSLIASPRPSLLLNRLDDVHLLDLIKVMREGGRDGRMDAAVEEEGGRWKNREKGG